MWIFAWVLSVGEEEDQQVENVTTRIKNKLAVESCRGVVAGVGGAEEGEAGGLAAVVEGVSSGRESTGGGKSREGTCGSFQLLNKRSSIMSLC